MVIKLSLSSRMFVPEKLQRCKLHDCHGACCEFGVWIDLKEKERIFQYADLISTCMELPITEPDNWFLQDLEEDSFTESGVVIHTKVVERNQPFKRKTCIFLRNDHKCALQVASESLEMHPWFLKPFYCILHPLDLNDNDQITLNDSDIILNEKRSCLRFSTEFITPIEIFAEEIQYLLGDHIYQDAIRKINRNVDLETNQNVE